MKNIMKGKHYSETKEKSESYTQNIKNLQLSPVHNIMGHLIAKQHKHRFFNNNFIHQRQRRTLIQDKISKLCMMLEYSCVTYYHAIGLFDAFMSLFYTGETFIDNVFVVCLIIASKFKESFGKVLDSEAFQDIQQTMDPLLFVTIERNILIAMEFNVHLITPFDFINLFLQIEETYECFKKNNIQKLKSKMINKIQKLLFMSSLDYEINKFTSLTVACSVIIIARKIMGLSVLWPPKLVQFTGFQETDLKACKEFIVLNCITKNADEFISHEINHSNKTSSSNSQCANDC